MGLKKDKYDSKDTSLKQLLIILAVILLVLGIISIVKKSKNYATNTETEIKLETLEKNGILTNLNDKYKNKSIYVQYVGNYFCCCSSKDGSTCNQEICKGTVTP